MATPRTLTSSIGYLLLAVGVLTAGCSNSSPGSGKTPSASSGASGAPISETAQPALENKLPPKVAQAKTLSVGVALGSPPDEFRTDSGEIVGWEVDIVTAAAQSLGLKVDLKPASFDSLIPALQGSRYDTAIGQFGVTAAREKVVDFVTTLQSNELFAALKDSNLQINGLEDLCGHSVSTTRGSREYEFAQAQNPKCAAAGKQPIDVKVFNDSNQAGLSLTSKRSELFWLGATAVSYFVNQTNGQTKVVGSYLKPNALGIAMPKNSGMAEAMRAAVQQLIDDGTYGKILDKWGLKDAGIKTSMINPEVTGG